MTFVRFKLSFQKWYDLLCSDLPLVRYLMYVICVQLLDYFISMQQNYNFLVVLTRGESILKMLMKISLAKCTYCMHPGIILLVVVLDKEFL